MIFVSSDDSEFEEWVSRNVELVIILIATVGTLQLRKKYKLINTYYVAALTARLGVEAAGLIIADQIDGSSGMDSWRRYSNRVFENDTLPDNIPILSPILGIMPDPIEVGKIGLESLAMIGYHFDFEGKMAQGFDEAVDFVVNYNPTTTSGRGNIATQLYDMGTRWWDRATTNSGFVTR